MIDANLPAISRLCTVKDIDVLDVIHAAAGNVIEGGSELAVYARLAVVEDCGWVSESTIDTLLWMFEDYSDVETME